MLKVNLKSSRSSLRCYCLVVNQPSESDPAVGGGLIVRLVVPEGCERWGDIIPGAHKAGKIQSKYAILTCHDILSHDSKEAADNKIYFIGSEKRKVPLSHHVCSTVSCCGQHSFIGPGETSLNSHSKNSCDMNLNFSLLFLDSAFDDIVKSEKLEYVEINLPLDDVKEMAVLMSALTLQSHGVPSKAEEADSFGVVVYKSNEDCFLSPVVVIPPINETPRKKITSLAEKIEQFDQFRRIKYHFGQDIGSQVPSGSPLVYRNPSSDVEEYCIIGIHLGLDCSGDSSKPPCIGQGLTLYGLFKMLEGGPVPCFSLLKNPQVNRLWQNRWECLILPYLRNDGLPLREVLEILQTLLEVHADGTSYLSVDVRDPLDTRMSVLKIMAALFKHFEAVSPDELACELKGFEKLYCNIKVRLISLIKCVKNVNEYPELDGQSGKGELAKVCIQFYCEVLNFKYKVEIEDLIRDNLSSLEEIYSKLKKVIPHLDGSFHTDMVILYKKLYDGSHGRSTELHEKYTQNKIKREQLQSLISDQRQKYELLRNNSQEQEKELEKRKKEQEETLEKLQFNEEQYGRISQSETSLKEEWMDLQRVREEQDLVIVKLSEEIIRLKESDIQLKEKYTRLGEENTQLKEVEISTLKEENARLREEREEIIAQQERKSEEPRQRTTRVTTQRSRQKSYAAAASNSKDSPGIRPKSCSMPSKERNYVANTITRSNTADSEAKKTSSRSKAKISK